MTKRCLTLQFILCLVFCLRETGSVAQTSVGYETISIAQGLSQGMVFDILQDKDGFIWVATKNGLNRYDGYDFRVFTNDPYDPHTLSSNTIIRLFEDSRGRIWAGTENEGVNIYDKTSGKFYRLLHHPTDPATLSSNAVRLIEELADGRVLVAQTRGGLNIVDPGRNFFEPNARPVITRLSLPNDAQVYGMGKDKDGTMWIGTMDGAVYRFDPLKNSFTRIEGATLLNNGHLNTDGSVHISNSLFLLHGNNVYPLFDIKKMRAGNLVFKPKQKLWENHHREPHFYEASEWAPGKPLKWNVLFPAETRLIYPFIIDRSGILWSGSVGYGLRKYNNSVSKFKIRYPGHSVRWIVPASSNDLYIGDFAYGWARMKDDSILPNPFNKTKVTEIDNFIISKTGVFWMKSDVSGYYNYDPKSGKLTSYPHIDDDEGIGEKQPLYEDSKNNIWFPGLGGRFSRLNVATGKVDSFSIDSDPARPLFSKTTCSTIHEDKQGVFWIGTQEGFARLSFPPADAGLPEVKRYYNNSSNRNSLNYNNVSCIIDDPAEPDRYLWICTKGGGLNRMNKLTGDFLHLTIKDGLPHDVVYGVVVDGEGNIWGSTNKGIFCMTSSNKAGNTKWNFRNFTKAYGLQDDEFNTGAYAKLQNGDLAFGGVNGLNIFNPKEVITTGFTPNVFITSIRVNNSKLIPGDKSGLIKGSIEQTKSITLNHLQDIITLEFASLDFTAPNQNNYRYRLDGADEAWIESGSRRSATYLHLPPGKYVFEVQGSNSQGTWSEKIAKLELIVLPPWWQTWWAYLAYVLLLGLAARGYFKFRVNREKLKAQLNFEQREAKRVKEIDSLKTHLYTNITHEFRTPLTVILGMARQVMKNPAEYAQNGLDMIIRNGESLLKLVNEMLDLSKLETGKMSLQLVNGDVIGFLRYIVESFNSLAESQQKQLHFLSEVDSLNISYDPEKLRQIVANLLSNALKFTPVKGNIYIATSHEKINNSDTLVIKVKDTGIGIPEDQLTHIFERFYQLDNSLTRKMEGTGIGLSLTKELVKLMHGEIVVKSPPTGGTRGTEFTVSIPVQPVLYPGKHTESTIAPPFLAETAVIGQSVIPEVPPGNGKPLVLLVEDNADVVAYTASCLPDYRLAVGKDGREGFEIATTIIPDLVITDVMMPFVDGFEMCSKLRKDERTSHIPIIMLTAKADIESRIEGLERGADAYLEKPFHKEELLVRIKKLLELRASLQQSYARRAGLTVTNPEPGPETAEPVALNEVENEFVQKVKQAVEEHLSDDGFTVEQLCKYVFMSHSQLHRKLDAVTGCSPNKFIRIIRMNRAKSLLSVPGNSIGSISLECGYNDPGYFARVFKQEFGVTPQEWRASKVM